MNNEHNFPDIKDNTPLAFNNYINAIKKNRKRTKKITNELKKYILERVKTAIDKLYESDVCLLETGMNELTITGRLAIYLQKEFENIEGYYIDIEYYRLRVPKEEVKDLKKDRIRCDILLHSRGFFDNRVDNLLAIEVKLEDSIDNGDSDRRRLVDFVLPATPTTPPEAIHSTLVGLYLRLGKSGYSQACYTSMGYTMIKN